MNSSPCYPYISFGPLATRTCARERGRECERERGRGRPATPACVPVCVVVTTHVFFLYVFFLAPTLEGQRQRGEAVWVRCVWVKNAASADVSGDGDRTASAAGLNDRRPSSVPGSQLAVSPREASEGSTTHYTRPHPTLIQILRPNTSIYQLLYQPLPRIPHNHSKRFNRYATDTQPLPLPLPLRVLWKC